MAEGNFSKIPLRGKHGKGRYALVDPELFDRLSQYKWTVREDGYVVTQEPRTNRQIRMHHVVMFSQLGVEVDHTNGDTLDNRRENLRVANHRQNLINRGSWGEIEFKGVRKNACGDAKSSLYYKGEEFRLGTYPTPEAAAVAHDAFAAYFQGEYARLNFPDSTPLHPRIAQNLRTRRSINRGGDIFEQIRDAIQRLDVAEAIDKKAV